MLLTIKLTLKPICIINKDLSCDLLCDLPCDLSCDLCELSCDLSFYFSFDLSFDLSFYLSCDLSCDLMFWDKRLLSWLKRWFVITKIQTLSNTLSLLNFSRCTLQISSFVKIDWLDKVCSLSGTLHLYWVWIPAHSGYTEPCYYLVSLLVSFYCRNLTVIDIV